MKVTRVLVVMNKRTIANVNSVLISFTKGSPIPDNNPADMHRPAPKPLDSVGNYSKVVIISTLINILNDPLEMILTTY